MKGRQKAKCIDNGQGGFTLIETLVATVILTVGLLGMAALTVGIIKGNKLSNDLTTATTLAQSKMEDLKDSGYSALPTTDKVETEIYGSIADYTQYKRVTDTKVDTPETGMKTVTVTVYWGADDHHSEIKTIFIE